MIHRDLTAELERAATWALSVTLTGPRQSGKTTLCRAVFPDHPYRSLESPDDRAFAQEDPRAFLAQFPRGAVLDEVQRVPDLLSYLQGIIDADPIPGRWILSGSQNLVLLESITQSLAGRTAMHQLLPLSWGEIRRFPRYPASLEEAIFSGGYPAIFDRRLDPTDWLRSYVATYIERDVRMISNVGDLTAFQRFVQLCAGRTAQLINYSQLADDCSISQPTAKAWFSVLEACFIAFHLKPFSMKQRKRIVKMPKLYFYDTGLACWLLGIREPQQLSAHPLRGALFETWVVSEALKHRTQCGRSTGLSFYRDRHGSELDLIVDEPDVLTMIEAKSGTTPNSSLLAGAMRVRPHLLGVRPRCDLAAVYGGEELQQRSDSRLVPWRQVRSAIPPRVEPLVQVFAQGQPVGGVDVLVLFPNGRWRSAKTDERGRATFHLAAGHIPMTVFVAGDRFALHEEPAWVPDECGLHVQLTPRPEGGACVVEGATPGIEVEVVVEGRAVAIDLLEGEQRVLQLKAAEGPGPMEPGRAYPRELALRVVKVLEGAAVLKYGRASNGPATDS